MSDDVESFKQSCNIVSEHLLKITKRSHSINNLYKSKGHHNNKVEDVWLPCCRLGIPCSSRIIAAAIGLDSQKCKSLIIACSELKYCLHSTKA